MARPKKKITFLKISPEKGAIREYRISKLSALLLLLAVIFGAFSIYAVGKRVLAITGVLGDSAYYSDPLISKRTHLKNLRKENVTMETHLGKMRQKISMLDEKIDKLREDRTKIEQLMNIESYVDEYLESITVKTENYKKMTANNLDLLDYYTGILEEINKKPSKVKHLPSVIPCTTESRIIRKFGQCRDPFTGKILPHLGIDFSGPRGSSVYSAAAGTVSRVNKDINFGHQIHINQHNGFTTVYAHLEWPFVKPGQKVKKNQRIATMGESGRSSGVHLHYEVIKDGEHVNPDRFFFLN
ncbi:MAG: M23 family metallopeptidase [Fibrobacterota bacterium]